MNAFQKKAAKVFVVWFLAGIVIGFCIGKSLAADLPLPKPHPRVIVMPTASPTITLPERCLVTGENPDPGQTLHVDKRCKSGMRWVYQR